MIDGKLEHHLNNITLYRSEVEHLISGIFDLLYFVHLTFHYIFQQHLYQDTLPMYHPQV